jgi:hypothetical protein
MSFVLTKKAFFQVSYSKEHIEGFPLSQWDIKLITKLGNDVVSKDKILSANDVIGDRIRQLKVCELFRRKIFKRLLFSVSFR